VATAAENLDLVRRYRAAFATYDPEVYEPFLAADPLYHTGMAVRRGREAFRGITASARVLYPHGALRTTDRRVVAQGDWVAVLVEREAVTNSGAHYDNVYTFFYEVRDGLVQTQVELLDFRISDAKFDLAPLAAPGSGLRAAAETRPPRPRATPPADDDASPAAAATRTALRFLDAFLTFDAERFEPLLGVDPLHQVGMTKRTGRQGFRDIARAGRILYPDGIAERTHHVLASDGRTVATLFSLRARTHTGADYENLYGMFLDVHDGRVVSLVEVLDSRVADRAFDLTALQSAWTADRDEP
jgi:ketosteroid isomerase-like protein